MKVLLRFLLLFSVMPQLAVAANMLYRQSFETPIESNPEIQWITAGYEPTQAVVDHQPKDRSKSVRGNFNSAVVDPITKMRGANFTQFKINFRKVPALQSWYATTDKIFVSWWFKLDKCHWKGTAVDDPDPIKVSGKYAYIKMNENPATSYYFSMRGGEQGEDILSVNDPNWMKFWETKYKIAALWMSNSTPNTPTHGSDGIWHKFSFLIGKRTDGQKYLQWWIDDSLVKADKYEPDGRSLIENSFIMDSIQFWHSVNSGTNLSENVAGNVAQNQFCNGWQIDDIQVWDDVPSKPKPPIPN
jgi:hypothetical protein